MSLSSTSGISVPKASYLYADSKAQSKVESKQSIAKVAWTDLAKEVMHGEVLHSLLLQSSLYLASHCEGKDGAAAVFSTHCILVGKHHGLCAVHCAGMCDSLHGDIHA